MPNSRNSQTFSSPAWLSQTLLRRFVQGINHLIAQNPQAQSRLAQHAGKVMHVRAAGFEWMLGVTSDGCVEPVQPDQKGEAVALTLEIDSTEVVAAKLRGERIGLRGVRIQGDADFAQAMSWLLGHLRWDAEDDLSWWLGDVAAHRIARTARRAGSNGMHWCQRIEADLRDWLAEAPRGLVARREFVDCSAAVAALRDSTARLDKRIQTLRRHRIALARD